MHLIKECNEESRKHRENMHQKENVDNVKCIGSHAMKVENKLITRLSKEIIRIIDTKKSKKKHVERKFGCPCNFIDAEARNAYSLKKVISLAIKSSNSFNHHKVRSQIINNALVESECPCYDYCETILFHASF